MPFRRTASFSVGKKLREIRIQKALSQRELSKRSGLPSSQISRIENGYRVPSLETLERITAALGVPLSYVFYDAGISHSSSTPAVQEAISRIIRQASEKGTGDDDFLLSLKTMLPRLTGGDCDFILSVAKKMAAAKRRRK
jgi:transcriptional regulator with XRE-family HTH domain